jgi:hypothetical protein
VPIVSSELVTLALRAFAWVLKFYRLIGGRLFGDQAEDILDDCHLSRLLFSARRTKGFPCAGNLNECVVLEACDLLVRQLLTPADLPERVRESARDRIPSCEHDLLDRGGQQVKV